MLSNSLRKKLKKVQKCMKLKKVQKCMKGALFLTKYRAEKQVISKLFGSKGMQCQWTLGEKIRVNSSCV
jgi:hypothetical protein